MTATLAEPRFERTTHLVDLIADAERLAALIVTADATEREALAATTHQRAVLATLRLDASPLREPPADLDPAMPREVTTFVEREGTWLDAMGNATEVPDEAILALEYHGTVTARAADDLAGQLLTQPEEALPALHRRLTAGLLDDAHAGVARRSELVVHDGASGRVIFFPSEPDAIPSELASITSWVAGAGAREHALIVSGVLHHELLRIHPFEAANGRLARTAATLILRTRGLDPAGLAAPEVALVRDPLGYHDEVRHTIRRRDLTIWLERWSEAVVDGLRAAARELGVLKVAGLPDGAAAFLVGRDRFTIADYRADVGVGPERSRADLATLLDAGAITCEPGTRGLRYRVA